MKGLAEPLCPPDVLLVAASDLALLSLLVAVVSSKASAVSVLLTGIRAMLTAALSATLRPCCSQHGFGT